MRRVLIVLVVLAAVSVALGLWLHTPRSIDAGAERPTPATSTGPRPDRDANTPRPSGGDPSQTPIIPSDPSVDKNEGMGVLMKR